MIIFFFFFVVGGRSPTHTPRAIRRTSVTSTPPFSTTSRASATCRTCSSSTRSPASRASRTTRRTSTCSAAGLLSETSSLRCAHTHGSKTVARKHSRVLACLPARLPARPPAFLPACRPRARNCHRLLSDLCGQLNCCSDVGSDPFFMWRIPPKRHRPFSA